MRILKFEASWCNTCKALDKELSKLKDLPIEHIDVDEEENEPLVDKYKVRSLPTLVIIDNNGKEEILHGVIKAEDLKRYVDSR